jgi:hypothetical protein
LTKLEGAEAAHAFYIEIQGKIEKETVRLEETNTARELYIKMIYVKKETRRYDLNFFNSSRYLVIEVQKSEKCMENGLFCKNWRLEFLARLGF